MPQDRAQRPGSPSQASFGSATSSPAPGNVPNMTTGAPAQSNAGTYFLGRYRVVDEIGIGGMASVHLARMDGPGGFQKWVAIKRIHPHLIEDDTFIHMFLDEARVAARISHPNVATVFELGKHEDTYWIAMEYLHGEPLREVMRRTEELGAPMPPEIACRVIADAAEGLHAAHELLGKNGEKLNLIHRDVTPHNLFVTYDGTTKVVDFGIAKFSSRMSSTRAGTLKGKLAYMSPEQVQGETIDRRTDIFALGVVLWELTTGQRLFRMESDLDTLAKVQECNIPRPSTIVRGYPIDLEKIVMKALSKNRGERFKTAREFSRALQSLLMRRGLFIASDEVAGYIQSIFAERIQKREAHLRWAGDVTQTINVDGMLAPTPEGIGPGAVPVTAEPSIHSYQSEVQPSPHTMRAVPRPAAGAPPAVTSYLASSGASPASAPTMVPQQKDSPPLQNLGETMEAPTAVPGRTGPPRPNLSVKTAPQPFKPAGRPSPPNAQAPAKAQAPAQEPHPADLDDGPTIQATPEQRQAMQAGIADGSGFDDDFDDNDATIVTTTRVDPAQVQSPLPAAGRPMPAAGRPAPPNLPQNQGLPYGYQPQPGQMNSTLPMQSPLGGPQRTLPIGTVSPTYQPAPGVNPFALTVPPNINISDPSLPETRAGVAAYGLALPSQQTGEMGGRQNIPTSPRLFAPPAYDQRTQTAQSLKRRVPMWAVAVGSGLAALLLAGLLFLLLTSATSGPKAGPSAPGSAAPSTRVLPAPTVAATTPPPAGAASAGLFSTARSGFLSVLSASAPAPTSMLPSTTPSLPAGTAAITADTTPRSPPQQPQQPAQAAPQQPQQPAAAPAAQPHQGPSRLPSDQGPTATGLLTIVCLGASCDQVFDNGKPLGPAPIFKRTVPVGSHRIKLIAGSFTKTVSAIVMADQVVAVRESMQP